MAYNEKLNDRVRETLADLPDVIEKYMFGGVCYMVNGKMCIGVMGDELMCRVGENNRPEALGKPGCRQMDFTGRPMKGYVLVSQEGMRTASEFRYWVDLCLDFNPEAKASPSKKRTR